MSDSDDFDLGEAPPSRYSNLGKRSIQAMLENTVVDRVESKRQSKYLQLTRKSPNTEYQNELWHTRLTAFRKHTLGIQNAESKAPTGIHLERFFATIVKRLEPLGGIPLSIDSLRIGLSSLISASTFYYADFSLTRHDSSRIESMFQSLLLQNKICNQPKSDKQWVGAFVVSKLVRRMYESALDSGVANWDVTLAKIQSIVLLAALACRVGDITQGQRDRHKHPFLTYDDLTVKLIGGDDIQNMAILVRMRNNKGEKGIAIQSSSKRLTSQNGPMSLHLCPIKIMLILALRLGNVKGATTIEDVLAQTAARRDRTVQWTDPFRPVLPAFAAGGVELEAGEAANSRQLSETLNQAGRMIGPVGTITPHALRRGTAQDLCNARRQNMPSADSTAALGEVQAMLAHSHETLRRGVLKEYTGAVDPDYWTPRLEANFNDDFTTPFMAGEADAFLPSKNSSSDVDAFCKRFNLDPTLRKDRLTAGRKGKQAALDSWGQRMRNATVLGRDQAERAGIVNSENIEQVPLHEEGGDVDDTDEDTQVSSNSSEQTRDPGAWLGNLLTADNGTEERQDNEEAMMASLMDDVMNPDLNRDSTLQLGSSSVEVAQSPPSAVLADITPLEFVRKFSAINTSTSHKISTAGLEPRNK